MGRGEATQTCPLLTGHEPAASETIDVSDAAATAWPVSNLHTLLVGLVALTFGNWLMGRIPQLRRIDIPAAVIGGVLLSCVTAAIYAVAGVEIAFATELRDVLLLVFFVTIGLSAKLSALRAGGMPLVMLCLVTVLLLVVQNVVGIAVALGFDKHPFLGLLAGSISFVGGPGTAMAWAGVGTAMGVPRSPELALAAATLAVTVGALVSGPITGWLIRRRRLHGTDGVAEAPWVEPEAAPPRHHGTEQIIRALLLIFVAIVAGNLVNQWVSRIGLVLPGFLTAMVMGVVLTNVIDALGIEVDFGAVEHNGDMALQIFLAISLMSLKLWTITDAVPPLLTNAVLQVVVTTAVALFVLFPLLGRDYDAAVVVGGFLGFGLSSMPVAMATMEQVTSRFGPAPRAFLLITLAGSFFVDLANGFAVKAFLLLPMFE